MNRQFRYEERDGQGHVVGRYGFYDKYGKLQACLSFKLSIIKKKPLKIMTLVLLKVVNYSADPLTGFHAEGAGVPQYPH